jgi:phosphopantothenoylcysteine decarboxylase/phosphopantothenate--cysteine ligase
MKGKKIIIGITGSIAAYKTAILVRLLVKAGAEVKVIMTPAAKDFITPLTLSVLSKEDVLSDTFEDKSGRWTNHVELGLWADLMVIAPTTANTIGKMATGICDNLLLMTYLSARCPVFIAPAMDLDMWTHKSTQDNLAILKKRSVRIISPIDGELASGLVGEGRMEEPEGIFRSLSDFFNKDLPLTGMKVMVTAGPTYESIDPVRFIGNRSTGTMGFRIAEALADQGANVTLITGPTALTSNHNSIRRFNVETADEMLQACRKHAVNSKLIIMSAAVADYTPKEVSKSKIKKGKDIPQIPLIPTTDILAELGATKATGQVIVGFALETNNEMENAKGKLKNKNLDFIVLNSLQDEGAGFGHNTNKISIIDRSGEVTSYETKSKTDVAADLVNYLIKRIK